MKCMGETYTMSSALPPAALRAWLEQRMDRANRAHQGVRKLTLRWKNETAITLYLAEYAKSSGSCRTAEKGRRSFTVSAGVGASWAALYSNVFHGFLAPEGSGSVVWGQFRLFPAIWPSAYRS